VDDLLVAIVAGCAGDDSATNLTAAIQGRALLAIRYEGVVPGAATTAHRSVAAVERFISEIGAALERRDTEPSSLRRVRERIQAREANAAQETLTPLEAYLVNEIEINNTAHTDTKVRSLRLRSTRGGDESRRLPVVAAGGVNRTEAEGGGKAVATVQQVSLTALNDLGSAVGKGLWAGPS